MFFPSGRITAGSDGVSTVPASSGTVQRLRAAIVAGAVVAFVLLDCGFAGAQQRPGDAPVRPAETGAADVASIGGAVIDWLMDVVELFELRRGAEPRAAFNRSIADAIASHPQNQAQQEAVSASRGAIDEAWSGYLPTITGSSDGGYRRVGPTFEGQRAVSRNGLGAGIQARQMIYDFGATSAVVSSAEQKLEAFDARRRAVEAELAIRAIGAHLDVMRTRLLVGLAERNVSDRRQIVRLLQSRREIGGGASPDILRAESRLASGRSVLAGLENRMRTAEAAYREAFGGAPGKLSLSRFPELALSLEQFLGVAKERHPVLLEARANARAAKAEAEAASARALPNIGLEGGVSRREQIGDGVPATDASVLLVFKYNFYTGGADTARKQQALARARQAELDARATELQLERAIRQTHAEVDNIPANYDAKIMSVMASADTLRANREQMEANRGSIIELLKAQEELFDAGRELVEFMFDSALSRYRLLQFTGGLLDEISIARVPRN